MINAVTGVAGGEVLSVNVAAFGAFTLSAARVQSRDSVTSRGPVLRAINRLRLARLLCRIRHDAQLQHHAERVHQDSGRNDLLSSESVDHHAPHANGTVRRRNAQELTLMGAGPDKPAHYFVALRDLFFDSPVRIRKRGSNADQRFLETLESRTLSWEGNFLHHVTLEVVAGRLDVATGENPVKEFSNTSLVPVGHAHLSQIECAPVYSPTRAASDGRPFPGGTEKKRD